MAILYNEYDKVDFILRRVKRLLPAYYVTVLGTLLVTSFRCLPNESTQVVTQSLFASTLMSNIGFWMRNSYFSHSDFNPLLHLWSLGVEIQFYLIVPFICWLSRKSKHLLPTLTLCTMLLCFAVVGISPKTSFFMMPLRVWEFLIGYIAAAYFSNEGNIKSNSSTWVGTVGLLNLLGIPAMTVDGNALGFVNGHPGMYAFITCIATALILIFGLPKSVERSTVGRTLDKLGTYSYSIYLVHYPVIVL